MSSAPAGFHHVHRDRGPGRGDSKKGGILSDALRTIWRSRKNTGYTRRRQILASAKLLLLLSFWRIAHRAYNRSKHQPPASPSLLPSQERERELTTECACLQGLARDRANVAVHVDFDALTCRNPPIPKKNTYETTKAGMAKSAKLANLRETQSISWSFQAEEEVISSSAVALLRLWLLVPPEDEAVVVTTVVEDNSFRSRDFQ